DDGHGMDESSNSLLRRGIGRLGRLPWLICVARRDAPRGLQLDPGGVVTLLPLGPLHPHAATALAETVAGDLARLDPLTLERVVERAGGNPLFLHELLATSDLQQLDAELPESLEAVVNNRIDALPAD